MKQFDVWRIDLGPVRGLEMAYKHPCVVLSRAKMNRETCIVAPMTTTIRNWPARVRSRFRGVEGEIALDQMRCIDVQKRRLRRLGALDADLIEQVKAKLETMFSIGEDL